MLANGYAADTISGKVVIVEDDDLMQKLMIDIFMDLGADCTAFVTADDALIHLMRAQSPCALLVTDFTLSGQLDGRELAVMVHERWSDMPVILTTGYGHEVGRNLPDGIVLLFKPWSVEALVQTATQMINPNAESGQSAPDLAA